MNPDNRHPERPSRHADAPATIAWIGLGANLGDPGAMLGEALRAIDALPDTRVQRVSRCYRSAPVQSDGPDYLNAVAQIGTALCPEALLRALLAIETRQGRERPYRHAPRLLDLDLLLHGESVRNHPDLILPHPRMHERAFVLAPLAELEPDFIVPGHGPVSALLSRCRDQRCEALSWGPGDPWTQIG